MPVYFAMTSSAYADDIDPPPIDSSLAGAPGYQANNHSTSSETNQSAAETNRLAEKNALLKAATDKKDDPSSGSSGCQFDENQSVSDMLGNSACKPNNVITASDYKYDDGARERVIEIANQIIFVGSLLSVGAIVYAGFILVTAIGDDEKIKNGKNSLKFGIIGFVIMLIAFPLVNAIVDIFYTVGA